MWLSEHVIGLSCEATSFLKAEVDSAQGQKTEKDLPYVHMHIATTGLSARTIV